MADLSTDQRNIKIRAFFLRHPNINRKAIARRYYISYDLAKKILLKIDRRNIRAKLFFPKF